MIIFRAFAGSIPGSGTLIYYFSITGERIRTEYWLIAQVKPALEYYV